MGITEHGTTTEGSSWVYFDSLFRDWIRNERVHTEMQIITSKFQSVSVKIYGIHTSLST